MHYVKWYNPLGILEPTSDASEWGCGAVFQNEYISLPWSDEIKTITGLNTDSRNMPLCEAIAVAISISTWHAKFANRQVLSCSDCLPVVHGINKGRSRSTSSPWLNAVYRFINRICHKHNIFLRAEHIRGTDNTSADLVSRNLISQLHDQAGTTLAPAHVLPVILQPSVNTHVISFPPA